MGLGRGPCPLLSTSPAGSSIPTKAVSVGRAQHSQVESSGEGKRKMQELFLHVVSSGNILLPFLSQKHVVLELVNSLASAHC